MSHRTGTDYPELPKLEFDVNQEQFDAWFEACKSKTREATKDDKNPFYFIDLNDGVMNFATLCEVVSRYPDRVEKAKQHCAEIVDRGIKDLGMAMGAGNIADLLDVDRKEVETIMFKDLFNRSIQR